jgi:RNA polymerase sigma-70 factor, ECF subfamily
VSILVVLYEIRHRQRANTNDCRALTFQLLNSTTVDLTSASLLDRLKVARSDASDWHRFESMYRPLIRCWIARIPGLGDEIDDVVQEVLVVVVREIPRFVRQREGSFRAWLRRITVNRVRAYRRQRFQQPVALGDQTEGFLDRMVDSKSDLARKLDKEHDQYVCDALLSAVRPDFNQPTWDAFQQFAVEGRRAADVARELGVTVNSVVKAKTRILIRLRQEAGALLD